MALRVVSRINLYTRLGRYSVGCGITERYRRVSAGSATVLQAYGMEPYCAQKRGTHHARSRADTFSFSTSRIVLATGVVLILGSAG